MSADINAELQELLNISVAHVRQQGRASFALVDDDKVECLYRSADGACCAAGPFVKHYQSPMEGKGFVQLVQSFANDLEPLAVKHAQFVLTVLQQAHDASAAATLNKPADFLAEYEARLSTLVVAWNLRWHTQLVVSTPAPVVEAGASGRN